MCTRWGGGEGRGTGPAGAGRASERRLSSCGDAAPAPPADSGRGRRRPPPGTLAEARRFCGPEPVPVSRQVPQGSGPGLGAPSGRSRSCPCRRRAPVETRSGEPPLPHGRERGGASQGREGTRRPRTFAFSPANWQLQHWDQSGRAVTPLPSFSFAPPEPLSVPPNRRARNGERRKRRRGKKASSAPVPCGLCSFSAEEATPGRLCWTPVSAPRRLRSWALPGQAPRLGTDS
ncbi:formin-like protein 5 [Melopsittacus undulatus]|uniref:formin-like protein 5 n=1 Tax=Melopsittacus undulatus TaxID=13146 RepID=UPI00146CB563|nr:formin-like protein 5 [Melopsittacus undulatus]